MMKFVKYWMMTVFIATLGCSDHEPPNTMATTENEILRKTQEQFAHLKDETEVGTEKKPSADNQPTENSGSASLMPSSMPQSCRAYIEDVKRCVQKTNNSALLDQLNKQTAVLFDSAPAKNSATMDAMCRQAQSTFQRNLARLGCAEDTATASTSPTQ
ncbi:MAG: hypothetical protein LBG61_06915 [Burkholderiales bacterium]|jgi:hypothetical protein|nr:hypothetical protein [Burkholderiales bacterium]